MAHDSRDDKSDSFQEMKEGLLAKLQTKQSLDRKELFPMPTRHSTNGPLKEFAWNTHLTNQISSDNLADELLRESVQELQKALHESQMLLEQRDRQISELRKQLENSKKAACVDTNRQEDLLKELEGSQRRVFELETELAAFRKELELAKSEQRRHLPPRLFQSDEETSKKETTEAKYSTCTCYCGSMCRALKEASEAKQKLDCVEKKYSNLKQRIRERRRAAESMSRGPIRVTVTEKSPGCQIQ